MIQTGFAPDWSSLIMRYISTVSYSMVLNGKVDDRFEINRGLRQGGPLSSFLFLICSEGLSSLLRLAECDERLRGAKASRNGPSISHLLFTDDSILFGEASVQRANVIRSILHEYEQCSGQSIKFNKSLAFFSTNTDGTTKNVVASSLGVGHSNNTKRYLGLPSMVGRRKKAYFQN